MLPLLHVLRESFVVMADQSQAEMVHPGALQIRIRRLSQQRLRCFTKQNGSNTCWESSPEKNNIPQYVSHCTENSCYEEKVSLFFLFCFGKVFP